MSSDCLQPHRPALRRAVLMTAAVLAILSWGAARALAAAAPVSPETVDVTTSRGVFDLVVYPARQGAAPAGSARPDPKPVVLLISGEGGWKSFDVLLSQFLSDDGYWIGGVDARAYFWEPQDDRGLLAGDMRAYTGALQKAAGRPPDAPVILAGYSFGADLAPFIGGAPGWGGRVKGLVLVGPDEDGSLEFRYTEMLGFKYKDHAFSVAGALKSSAGIPTVFIHGSKDGWSKAPELHGVTAEPRKLLVIPDATHHFGGHRDELRAALREGMEWLVRVGAAPPPGGAR